MQTGLYIRLSIMMFLQYMVWGLWFIKLGSYLPHLGISGYQMGNIFMAFFSAFLISPFIGGQLADRYLPSQIVMALAHLIGGGLLWYSAGMQNYNGLWWLMFAYALVYAPTLALCNSISFHNLKDPDTSFGSIRVWGTIGWVMAGLVLTVWWSYVYPFNMEWSAIAELGGGQAAEARAEYITIESWLFKLAGIVSLFYGGYCFLLPHTPPKKESENPFAFLKALSLCKDKNFAFFVVLSFIVATELQFFYMLTPPFLESSLVNISPEYTSGFMSVFAQGAEGLTLLLVLPFALRHLGLRKTIAIGIIAWPIRYAIFSMAFPWLWWIVVLSLALHGICYVFFFIAGQMFVDRVAPKDIRHSAQSLIFMVTFGGLAVGSMFVGWIEVLFTNAETDVINYRGLFLVPTVLTVLCAIAFVLFFKEPEFANEDEKEVESQPGA